MSTPPTIVTGRRRQRELLRSWSGWALTSILIEPGEVARARESGWAGTHHRDPETGERIVGTAAGLGFGVDVGWRNPVEVIPWSQLEEIATAVPGEVRQQLVEFRSRWRKHQSASPRFVASAAAIGRGPIEACQPLTPRQVAYVSEHEAFEASGVLPAWEKQRSTLDTERLNLHAVALSLDTNSDPGDLLELLEDQHIRHHKPEQISNPTTATQTSSEIRACVEDTQGTVTSTGVADADAQFFTLYQLDDAALPQAISDHLSREAAQHPLDATEDAGKEICDDTRIRLEVVDHHSLRVAATTTRTTEVSSPAGRPALQPPSPNTIDRELIDGWLNVVAPGTRSGR